MVLLVPGPVSSERVAAFTLRTALAWVGHVCTGRCPLSTVSMPAQAWVVRQIDSEHPTTRPHGVECIVLVDFGGVDTSIEAGARLVEVNACTAADHITVYDVTDPAAARRG